MELRDTLRSQEAVNKKKEKVDKKKDVASEAPEGWLVPEGVLPTSAKKSRRRSESVDGELVQSAAKKLKRTFSRESSDEPASDEEFEGHWLERYCTRVAVKKSRLTCVS